MPKFRSYGVSGKHHNQIQQTDGSARHVPSDVWSPAHRHKKWFKNEAHHNHRRRSTAAVQCTSSGSEIGRPTSCRESVIGSFSSVICFSNTGLADVDGASSSMFFSTFRVKTINKEIDSKWITYSLFVSCGYNCIFKHVNAKPRQRKLAK